MPTRSIYRTEIKPGKHPDTRTKPLALVLANGHGRYISVTPERKHASVGEFPLHIYSRYEFIIALILKRLRDGRFASETDMRRFQKRTRHLDPEVVKKSVGPSRGL